MVLLSEWDGNSPLYDVMCGSGTIPIEAAMIASNMAPNIYRKGFGFEKFSKFDKPLFDSIPLNCLRKSSINRILSTLVILLALRLIQPR
ncbi:MAG: hypothetical protein IPK03_10665 [Bacteroidetes bacterium]|nr:hypothetical protein [Bacteroidota bacterium]